MRTAHGADAGVFGTELSLGYSNQSFTHSPYRCLGSVVNAKFAENALDVLLDGLELM